VKRSVWCGSYNGKLPVHPVHRRSMGRVMHGMHGQKTTVNSTSDEGGGSIDAVPQTNADILSNAMGSSRLRDVD
jgi:hypothetical protein